MSESKHPYKNEITLASFSGETGEPLLEVIWRQRYATKEQQVEELQNVTNGLTAKLMEITYARAEKEMGVRAGRR